MRLMSEKISLKDVVDRLDQLIILWKLANRSIIQKFKEDITKDPISRKILDLADGSRDYTTLAEEVSQATGKSSRTAKGRISELSEKGAIRGIKKEGKVYYQSTGLYD